MTLETRHLKELAAFEAAFLGQVTGRSVDDLQADVSGVLGCRIGPGGSSGYARGLRTLKRKIVRRLR